MFSDYLVEFLCQEAGIKEFEKLSMGHDKEIILSLHGIDVVFDIMDNGLSNIKTILSSAFKSVVELYQEEYTFFLPLLMMHTDGMILLKVTMRKKEK